MLMTILKGRTFIVLIILVVFFSIVKDNFLDPSTMTMIAKHVALYGILALGMTFVIILGGVDHYSAGHGDYSFSGQSADPAEKEAVPSKV